MPTVVSPEELERMRKEDLARAAAALQLGPDALQALYPQGNYPHSNAATRPASTTLGSLAPVLVVGGGLALLVFALTRR